jgi:hypothetical protein
MIDIKRLRLYAEKDGGFDEETIDLMIETIEGLQDYGHSVGQICSILSVTMVYVAKVGGAKKSKFLGSCSFIRNEMDEILEKGFASPFDSVEGDETLGKVIGFVRSDMINKD